jgi:hypothetical protein
MEPQQSAKYSHLPSRHTEHPDFFQGQMDRSLFYWTNPSWETTLPKQEGEEVVDS